MKRAQTGVALITILMLVALATILAASIAKQQQATAENTAYLMRQNQALLYSKSAEAFFSELLVDDAKNAADVDHLQETWAQPMPAFPIDGGFVSGVLEDQSGKFNLNSLVAADGETVNIAAQQWFERLLVSVGLPAELSQAVIDWQDQNDEVSGNMGAENSYYASLANGYAAANQPFHHAAQLRQVRGFEGKNYALIRDYVTAAQQQDSTLNLNTASSIVLASLDPTLNVAQIDTLRQQRQANLAHWSHVTEFWATEPFSQVDPAQQTQLNALLGVTSNRFQAKIEVQFQGRQRQLTSDLVRQQQRVYVEQRSLAPF